MWFLLIARILCKVVIVDDVGLSQSELRQLKDVLRNRQENAPKKGVVEFPRDFVQSKEREQVIRGGNLFDKQGASVSSRQNGGNWQSSNQGTERMQPAGISNAGTTQPREQRNAGVQPEKRSQASSNIQPGNGHGISGHPHSENIASADHNDISSQGNSRNPRLRNADSGNIQNYTPPSQGNRDTNGSPNDRGNYQNQQGNMPSIQSNQDTGGSNIRPNDRDNYNRPSDMRNNDFNYAPNTKPNSYDQDDRPENNRDMEDEFSNSSRNGNSQGAGSDDPSNEQPPQNNDSTKRPLFSDNRNLPIRLPRNIFDNQFEPQSNTRRYPEDTDSNKPRNYNMSPGPGRGRPIQEDSPFDSADPREPLRKNSSYNTNQENTPRLLSNDSPIKDLLSTNDTRPAPNSDIRTTRNLPINDDLHQNALADHHSLDEPHINAPDTQLKPSPDSAEESLLQREKENMQDAAMAHKSLLDLKRFKSVQKEQTVDEGLEDVTFKIDQIEARLRQGHEDYSVIKSNIGYLKKKKANIASNRSKLRLEHDKTQASIRLIQSDMAHLRKKLDDLKSKVVTASGEKNVYASRIRDLEKEVVDTQKAIDVENNKLCLRGNDVNALQSVFNKLKVIMMELVNKKTREVNEQERIEREKERIEENYE